jgi:hypothetical protein
MPSISTETRRLLSAARLLGGGEDRVELTESEIFRLLWQCCADLAISARVSGLPPLRAPPPSHDYYRVPLEWYGAPQPGCPDAEHLLAAFASCAGHEGDFRLYFLNLTMLHKRRLKYRRILSTQPKPTMDQVGPRSLLEFGGLPDSLLASWLVWRKWIYDVDNRSAQETGYLFEPILASCLGGEAVGAGNSPVKRLNARGKPTGEGRQVDCYDGASSLAYEFKLRVTIAASGQGRFAEEVSFAAEARAAGLTPVLIVLDPTPSPRLDELIAAYKKAKGRSYVGDEAWRHMDRKAGATMATFLERYIRPPLAEMARHDGALPETIQLTWRPDAVTISGQNHQHVVKRPVDRPE